MIKVKKKVFLILLRQCDNQHTIINYEVTWPTSLLLWSHGQYRQY